MCDVVFGGIYSTRRFFRLSENPSVCAGQLSTSRSDFSNTLLSNHFNHSFHFSMVIQAFLLLEYRTGSVAKLTFLKQRGFLNLPITKGLSFFVPVALQQSRTVTRFLSFFMPFALSFLLARVLFGPSRKKRPVSSAL